MTRRAGKQSGNAQADLNAVQREASAFELRAQGLSFAQIAALLGYVSNGRPNESAAYKAYRRCLARIPRETVEEMRQNILAEQLEMKAALRTKYRRGDTFAAQAMTGIHDRQAKLFGLDTPIADAGLASHYTKRVVLCDSEPEPMPESEPAA